MFYIVEVEDYVRVEPKLFGLKTSNAVAKQLQDTYSNYHDKEIGEVIGVISVLEVGDGIIIPGDGAAYYNSCLLYTSPSPRDRTRSRMPSSA